MKESEFDRHAEEYRRTIEAFRDDRIDLESARRHPRLNANLDEVIIQEPGLPDAR